MDAASVAGTIQRRVPFERGSQRFSAAMSGSPCRVERRICHRAVESAIDIGEALEPFGRSSPRIRKRRHAAGCW